MEGKGKGREKERDIAVQVILPSGQRRGKRKRRMKGGRREGERFKHRMRDQELN